MLSHRSLSNLERNIVAGTERVLKHSKLSNLEKTLIECWVGTHRMLSDLIQYCQQNSVEMDNENHSKGRMPNWVSNGRRRLNRIKNNK